MHTLTKDTKLPINLLFLQPLPMEQFVDIDSTLSKQEHVFITIIFTPIFCLFIEQQQ